MLLEFSVENFWSFKDKVTFSMISNSSSNLKDNYIEIDKLKVLKTAAIYGANASGKTNLIKILYTVSSMLKNSNNIDINEPLPINPFLLDKDSINKPSSFEIKFIVDNIRYVYGFKATKEEVCDEYLYYYPNSKETKIFDRTNVNEYSFTIREKKYLKEIENKNSKNKFFLATATNWNYEKTKIAYDFLTVSLGVFFNLESLKRNSFEIYYNDITHNLKKFALEFLKKTDFNIIDYKIVKINFSNNTFKQLTNDVLSNSNLYHVLIEHKSKNSNSILELSEESLGTQLIFSLIPYIYEAINNKRIIIIDELDKSLHPLLVHHIVEIFNNKEINKSGSQLIFNTHDTNLLNLNILRRDQIWFTEKNNDTGISDLYSLSDFTVRKNENIEKGYMLGRYGAIPFITSDINLWDE